MAKWAICVEAWLEMEAGSAEDAQRLADEAIDVEIGGYTAKYGDGRRARVTSASSGATLHGPQLVEDEGDDQAEPYHAAYPERPI